MSKNIQLPLLILLCSTLIIRPGLVAQQIADSTATKVDTVGGIRAILLEKSTKKGMVYDNEGYATEFSVFTFDAKTLAMHVDQATWSKTQALTPQGDIYEISSDSWFPFNEYQYQKRPVYFDKEGYVYTKGKGKKGRWVKTPLTTLYKFMTVPFSFPNLFPELKLPEGNYTYYGIDVSPGRYPILEWAFRYKMQYFEASDKFKLEFVEYGGKGGYSKYTLLTGKDKGSFVIFDGLGRLWEINSIHSGMIRYTYGNYTVKLPDGNKTDYFADQVQLMELIKEQ